MQTFGVTLLPLPQHSMRWPVRLGNIRDAALSQALVE